MNTYKSYTERAKQHPNACARSLFELMERKQSNLSVAVDVTSKKELLAIADAVGPFVCVLKVSFFSILGYTSYKRVFRLFLDPY